MEWLPQRKVLHEQPPTSACHNNSMPSTRVDCDGPFNAACTSNYPCFLSGSVQFFFTLLFFIILLISSLGLALLLFSVLRRCSQFKLECIWPGKSRHCAGEGHCRVHAAGRRGAASSVCKRMNDSSETHTMAPIGCVDPRAVDSCKSNWASWWSHRQWIYTQLTGILFYFRIIMTILAS